MLSRKGNGKRYFSVSGSKVTLVKVFHHLGLGVQRQLKRYLQQGCTIMHSLWVANHKLVLFEVHIFNPQT